MIAKEAIQSKDVIVRIIGLSGGPMDEAIRTGIGLPSSQLSNVITTAQVVLVGRDAASILVRRNSSGSSEEVSLVYEVDSRASIIKCPDGFDMVRVQKGDSLWKLWTRRKDKSITWNSMMDANKWLKNTNAIKPGWGVCAAPLCDN